MQLAITGIPTDHADHLRRGGADANHQPPVRTVADGGRNPCRHCLGLIAPGAPMLIVGYRPFVAPQPYAEVGPIFLHAESCPRYRGAALPAWFAHLTPAIIRGYDATDTIAYATGDVIDGPAIAARAAAILADPAIAYVHVRSKFNCFQVRIDRG